MAYWVKASSVDDLSEGMSTCCIVRGSMQWCTLFNGWPQTYTVVSLAHANQLPILMVFSLIDVRTVIANVRPSPFTFCSFSSSLVLSVD